MNSKKQKKDCGERPQTVDVVVRTVDNKDKLLRLMGDSVEQCTKFKVELLSDGTYRITPIPTTNT